MRTRRNYFRRPGPRPTLRVFRKESEEDPSRPGSPQPLAASLAPTVRADSVLCFTPMTDKHLEELADEIKASLQAGAVADKKREALEQVHSELQAMIGTAAPVAKPPRDLRNKLKRAIEQLESDHPRLTNLLSKSLDLLSDVGI